MTVVILSFCLLLPAAWVAGQEEKPGTQPAQNAPPDSGEGSGTAVVRVVTNPEIGGGTFLFTGTPAGELTLVAGEDRSLTAAGLAPGSEVSKLSQLDPMVEAAGYQLTEIRCDDQESARPSSGNLENRAAILKVEEGETVTCVFVLSVAECICPKEGRWSVVNHPGSMVCTGSMSMTMPLAASTQTGTITIGDGCATLIGEGMSDDEATIQMSRTDDCGYRGTVGGSQDGIPMTIHFTFNVQDSEHITGDLHSTVSQSGTTCNMSRTYELTYSGP